jgi:serine/threonine-protein kinase
MATVHFGRLLGAGGFSKAVAIKRLYPQFARDPEFVSMFLDEARLAARIRHPNVVSTLDVVATDGEVFLVMEYVQGVPLSRLVSAAQEGGARIPPGIAVSILVGALHGLHAAHEATSERGEPLELVHRDVSPQNILVGVDGVARVLDFGVAKARSRMHTTRDGNVKGKLGYMSPEHVTGRGVTRTTDVFAASVVLWEALTGEPLFGGGDDGEVIHRILSGRIDPPSARVPGIPASLDEVTLRGLAYDAGDRFATARQMARALEASTRLPSSSEVGDYVEQVAGVLLGSRARELALIESDASGTAATAGSPAPDVPVGSPRAAHDASRDVAEPATQVATTSNTYPAPARPRAWKQAAAVVAAVLAGAALIAAMQRSGTSAGRAASAPSEAPSLASSASAGAPPAASVSPPAAVPSAEPAASSVAAAPPTSAPNVSRPRTGPPPAVRAATQSAAARCDPPFTVDATGYRHYKRECMR